MKFTWKEIKNLNSLPRGVEIMVCIKNHYCEYIRRADTISDNPNAWFYVYTDREIQEHKLKAFTHYFIPTAFIDVDTKIK